MKNLLFVFLFFAIALTSCNNEVKTIESSGGIRINLEVNNADLLNRIGNMPKDSVFQLCLKKTSEGQYHNLDEFLESFNKSLQEIDPSINLATYFATFEMKDKINYQSTNKQVIAVLKVELQKKLDETIINLTKRLENFSKYPAIVKSLEYNLILVEVPELFEKHRICNLLQSTGNLGFWETYENSEVFQYINEANKKLFELGLGIEKQNIETTNNDNTLLNEINSNNDSIDNKISKENPLFALLNPSLDNEKRLISGCVVGLADAKDTAQVNKYLALKQIKDLFPYSLRFLWTLKPINETTFFQLVAIRVTSRDGQAPLDGSVITSVKTENGSNGNKEISMSMNTEGARTWARFTRDNIGKQIAIVIDDNVYTFPIVNSEIKGGNSSISGNFTNDEAEDLASILNAGSCSLKLKVIAVDIKEPVKK